MMPREKWTDDRLDDLNKKVDAGFESVDRRFEKVETRFDKVDERFEKAREELIEVARHLGKKIDRLTYLLLAAALGYIATHGL